MPDPLTWYAAIIGSGGTLIAARHEVLQRRVRVEVDHGWRYFQTDGSPPQFDRLRTYVMATNTGGRNVVVQHVGWEFLVDTGQKGPEGEFVWGACRVEIPLEEPVTIEPDGVPLKVEVDAASLFHLVHPLDVNVRPVVFTGGGNVRWEGPWGPLMQRIPASFDETKTRQRIDELRQQAKPPLQMGSPELFYVEPLWAEGKGGIPVDTVSSAREGPPPTPPPL
jgi:hypothetical protein